MACVGPSKFGFLRLDVTNSVSGSVNVTANFYEETTILSAC